MTGAVIEIAHRLELPVPHTETVHACAKALTAARTSVVSPAAAGAQRGRISLSFSPRKP
jgi:hypothetical protein